MARNSYAAVRPLGIAKLNIDPTTKAKIPAAATKIVH
jgi:hypothetical protein